MIIFDRATNTFRKVDDSHTLTPLQEFCEFEHLREHVKIAITEQGFYDRRSESVCCKQP